MCPALSRGCPGKLQGRKLSDFLSFLDLGRGSGERGVRHQAPLGLKPSPATSCFTSRTSVFSPAMFPPPWVASRSDLRPLLCPRRRGRARGRLGGVSWKLACFLTSRIAPGSHQLLLSSCMPVLCVCLSVCACQCEGQCRCVYV